MNKTSIIRQVIEAYGFQQVKSKNCFISYVNDFCFQISFYKVGYGSRWAISISIHMLNAKQYVLYDCPENFQIYLDGFEISLKEWDANGERYPDKHSESMVFIINEYIIPYFTKIALFYKIDDFKNYITKREKPFIFEKKFKFKVLSNFCYIDNYEILLKKDEFRVLLNYLEENQYKYIKNEFTRGNLEITYFSDRSKRYIILLIEKELFLSFEVLSQESYELMNNNSLTEYRIREYKPVKIEKIRYYSGTLGFGFGWLIADCKNLQKNINDAVNLLDDYLKKIEHSD